MMLASLGVGCGVAMMSTVNTMLLDRFPKVPVTLMSACICVCGFCLGLVYVTPVSILYTQYKVLNKQSKPFANYRRPKPTNLVWFYKTTMKYVTKIDRTLGQLKREIKKSTSIIANLTILLRTTLTNHM